MISVIIPSYNAAKYISDAVRSVLSQTYTDYEIIVIDDGSTDDTRKIITSQFPMVKYIHTANSGVSSARNTGIRCARGDFIAFLDADDIWLPHKLEKQYYAFNADPELKLVFTEVLSFDDNGFQPSHFSKKDRLMQGDIVKNIFLYSYVGTPTVMVKRNVFDEIGYFEEGLQVAEDDNMWLRIAMRYKIDLIDEVLVHCRTRNNSLSRANFNFCNGVNGHINLIQRKYPELEQRLGQSTIRKKRSECYFAEAYTYFSKNDMASARAKFLQSFFTFPKRKSFMFLTLSCLPISIIATMRKVKQKIGVSVF